MSDRQHVQRIKKELALAGVTKYGLLKSESRRLPKIIHQDEHIMAVVYGQFDSSSAMLIATDKRMIFLDCKPMVVLMDEITYDVINGVEFDIHSAFATLVMQTNIANYTVRYANIKCASNFADFLESKRIGKSSKSNVVPKNDPLTKVNKQIVISKPAEGFLQNNFVGVISTVDRTGNVFSAVVYYVYYLEYIYILTKSSTQKARNVYAHNQVSFTVFNEQNLQTVQIQGLADVERNQGVITTVFSHMIQPRNYKGQQKLPPVAKNQQESYLVIKISPTNTKFSDFND